MGNWRSSFSEAENGSKFGRNYDLSRQHWVVYIVLVNVASYCASLNVDRQISILCPVALSIIRYLSKMFSFRVCIAPNKAECLAKKSSPLGLPRALPSSERTLLSHMLSSTHDERCLQSRL